MIYYKPSKGSNIIIPKAGEIYYNTENDSIKIGDGVRTLENLEYAILNIASIEKAKLFIEENIDLIDANMFDELYEVIGRDVPLARDVTKILLRANIDIKSHLKCVPIYIKNLLFENSDDKVRGYALVRRAKNNLTIEEFRKTVYNAMGIPADLMTIKKGE